MASRSIDLSLYVVSVDLKTTVVRHICRLPHTKISHLRPLGLSRTALCGGEMR